jgi:adenylate cyclase
MCAAELLQKTVLPVEPCARLALQSSVMAEQRKLAAILAADVVGFSRLTGEDEDRTLARLRALRSDLIDPTISVHNGRVVKRTGDGALIEFRSVVDAVRCAIEVQTEMVARNAGLPPERRIEFRVGIHLGDVVEENDGDLMGDGVNIAARIECVAEPGTICLSEDAYRQVRSRLDLAITDLGETALKNIAEPLRIYSLQVGLAAQSQPMVPTPAAPSPQRTMPDRPSIAVLPFENMSGDAEQEYFADGVAEEIITSLSQLRWLFVIARNSSFAYKGRAVDVKQVGKELGVRYIVEGSLRKASNRVRIAAQLIDSSTGMHLWAQRFDGTLDDIFDLQDQVTSSIVGAVAPQLEQAEIERSKRKPTESLDAYDYYLRAMACVHKGTRDANEEALRLFFEAIERDAEFAAAYGMAAWCYAWRKWDGFVSDSATETAEAERLARRAAELGNRDAIALCSGGYALVFVVQDLDDGVAFIDQGLALNPNLSMGWQSSGWTRVFLGEHDLAIEHFAQAMHLSPLDRLIYRAYGGTAYAHFLAGRYDEACTWAEKSFRERQAYLPSVRVAAASHALAGRSKNAKDWLNHLRTHDPNLRVSNLKQLLPLRRAEDAARFAEGLRSAGLPE